MKLCLVHIQILTFPELNLNCFFFVSRGALRNHSPSAPTLPSSGKPLPFFDFRRGVGMDLGSKLAESWWGGTGFDPRTSCMRFRSASRYATGATPFKSLIHAKCFQTSPGPTGYYFFNKSVSNFNCHFHRKCQVIIFFYLFPMLSQPPEISYNARRHFYYAKTTQKTAQKADLRLV